ncbi:MAG: hypothetical protein M1834_000032 [Cirrosporium novae-zelandiae]|nr:MAG: hypothetical protein M1834_000032 [Cirrosporium novae-zelandiae]
MDPLHGAEYHRGWHDLSDDEMFIGLRNADSARRQEWVVKLQFEMNGIRCFGTAFYINLGSSQYDIVLTAGHNLISGKKKRCTNLKIMGIGSVGEILVTNENIRICKSYEQDPGPKNAVNDYGAILIPLREMQSPRAGFGFNLKLSSMKEVTIEGELRITGYKTDTDPGKPITNSGVRKKINEHQLEYLVETEKGISGSPVWGAYDGVETVLGIHNHHGREMQNKGKSMNRGTRLNLDMLQTVCRWAEVGWRCKTLKVSQNGAPQQGLYLRLSKSAGFGRVRLGAKDLATTFDIFPAMTTSGMVDPKSVLYAFFFQPPTNWGEEEEESSDDDSDNSDSEGDERSIGRGEGKWNMKRKQQQHESPEVQGKWVRWNVHGKKVEWSDELRDDGLVKIMMTKKNTVEIVRSMGNHLQKLRMQANEIPNMTEHDDSHSPIFESSEISFERKAKTVKFSEFCFD